MMNREEEEGRKRQQREDETEKAGRKSLSLWPQALRQAGIVLTGGLCVSPAVKAFLKRHSVAAARPHASRRAAF